MNDRNKVMDRIRKLLAMAQDVSSPHEAAIAAGRARKLMDQHQVSELELTSSEPNRFESENFKTGNKTTDKFSGICGLAVAKLNDCVVSWKRDGNGYPYLKFDGMLGDAVCAVELYKYLRGVAYRLAEEHVPTWASSRVRADRNAYRLGFASGVADKVKEILVERRKLEMSDGRALVVVKNALVSDHFGRQRESSTRARTTGSSVARNAGYQAGYNAGLNRQVNRTGGYLN